MSRRANTQYTAGGTDFDVVTGGDIFLKKDLQALQAAVEGHDHTATKGLPVGRVGTASVGTAQMVALSVDATVLANNAVTTNKILDGAVTALKLAAGAATGAALGADVVTIAGAQNITGAKTLQSALLQNITTVDGAFREDRGNDVASATSIALGDDGNTFLITGNITITSITVKPAGTLVRLIFSGVLTVGDSGGGTLRLNGDFVSANESSLTLVSMGTYWQEVGRVELGTTNAKISAGVYSGNGANPRTIALPFTPKIVFITGDSDDGIAIATQTVTTSGVLLVDINDVNKANSNHPILTIAGFVVRPESGALMGTNNSGVNYTYIAFG